MTSIYDKTLEFLYKQVPMFQRVGASAYKPGIETSIELSRLFGNPHKSFKSIHVAGTNGKGSTSHLLASILQKSGYKVGLYTSPHLIDFRERIKVNGEMISQQDVINFVEEFRKLSTTISPSFFELTMIMAFDYFKRKKVDIAIVEVGLGGRLDSTNIITPELSIITNISFDHTQFLGNTLEEIAREKAGIIKEGIPCLIGEAEGCVRKVFENKASEVKSNIRFAEDYNQIISYNHIAEGLLLETRCNGKLISQLNGNYQIKNANTVLNALKILSDIGYNITNSSITSGFKDVCDSTGLLGRWMTIGESPKRICDTGHNIGGITYITRQLSQQKYRSLRIVIGFVSDKDVTHILEVLPKDAIYYFTNASIQRAMPASTLQKFAIKKGLVGKTYNNVTEAYSAALNESSTDDFIYIGGSTFIVADLLLYLKGIE